MAITPGTQSYIDSDGSLVTVPDAHANVTPDDIIEADRLEEAVLRCMGEIKISYIRLAAYLDEFENKNLYLAKGYTDFWSWVGSAEINIGSRVARDLLRIAREALPVLQASNSMDVIDGLNISTMRSLLPMLNQGEDKFVEASREVSGLTVKDAYEKIKEIRGKPPKNVYLKAFLDINQGMYRLEFIHMTDIETHNLGTLVMTKEQFSEFSKLFHGDID